MFVLHYVRHASVFTVCHTQSTKMLLQAAITGEGATTSWLFAARQCWSFTMSAFVQVSTCPPVTESASALWNISWSKLAVGLHVTLSILATSFLACLCLNAFIACHHSAAALITRNALCVMSAERTGTDAAEVNVKAPHTHVSASLSGIDCERGLLMHIDYYRRVSTLACCVSCC